MWCSFCLTDKYDRQARCLHLYRTLLLQKTEVKDEICLIEMIEFPNKDKIKI